MRNLRFISICENSDFRSAGESYPAGICPFPQVEHGREEERENSSNGTIPVGIEQVRDWFSAALGGVPPSGSESPAQFLRKIEVEGASQFIEEYLRRQAQFDVSDLIEFPGAAILGADEMLKLQDDMVEELADASWDTLAIPNPSTASLDAVAERIPYYILKQVGKQRAALFRQNGQAQSGTRLAYRTCSLLFQTLRMMLLLLARGVTRTVARDRDHIGGFYRKGVKRELDAWTTREPGEGGDYDWRYDDSSSDSGSDGDYSGESDCDMEDGSAVENLTTELRRLSISGNFGNPDMRWSSQLNGSHGEYTESDDVNKKGRRNGGGQKRRPGTIQTQRPRRRAKTGRKRVMRETGIALAGNFVGPEMARLGYQASAKLLRGARMSIKTLVLSSHASKYLMSFVKPFDNSVQQVSVPRPPAVRSFKVTGFIRGAGAIGAAGVGYVAVNPVLCSDRPCAFYTTNIYNHAILGAPPDNFSYTTPTYLNGGVNWPACAYMSNLPYTFAQLVANSSSVGSQVEVAGRIVSCSMRLYYTGTTLNEGGSYYAYSDPDVNNVLGDNHATGAPPTGYSIANLLSKDATEVIKIKNGSEARLVRVCTDPNMDDYPRANVNALRKVSPYSGGEYYNPQADYVGTANMVIALDGTPGQPFYFEVVTHVEYIGTGVTQGLLSDSNNDAVGYDCVKNLLQHAQREVASNPNKTFAKAMADEMRRQGVTMGNGQRSVDY